MPFEKTYCVTFYIDAMRLVVIGSTGNYKVGLKKLLIYRVSFELDRPATFVDIIVSASFEKGLLGSS